MNSQEIYYLSFRKQKENNRNNVRGWDVIKVIYYTSSEQNRKNFIDKYVLDGYVLIAEQTFKNLPPGFEEKIDVSTYWHTDGTMLCDPPAETVQEVEIIKKEEIVPVTEKEEDKPVCSHKYNCRAHRDVCVSKFGMAEIVR